jgi:hypothetical protein
MKHQIAILTLAASALTATWVKSAQPDLNGGSSWNGWTSKGTSDQLGVYGSGSASVQYEVYATTFAFNNHSVSGGAVGGGPTGGASGFGTGAFSTGAFANGNRMLGIGVRVISGGSLPFTPTVRFDLDNDSYLAASSVGGSDGRTSFTSWSETGDFTVQFEGANSWRGGSLTMQTGNGTSNGGPNNQQAIVGGIGSGVSYDWAFRAFAQASTLQMIFDLNAMDAIYGVNNPFALNANFTGIGDFGSSVRISLNGLGNNNVVFNESLESVPEATTVLAGAFLLVPLGVSVLRRMRKVHGV